MVFVPLALEPWAKFARGTKTVEVRSAVSPVAAQVRKAAPGAPVVLRPGYSTKGRDLTGTLGRVWTGYWETMPDWVHDGADVDWHKADEDGYFAKHDRLLCFEVCGIKADACHLCERGFPIEGGEHYGTQSLGMIPTTPCTSKEEPQ